MLSLSSLSCLSLASTLSKLVFSIDDLSSSFKRSSIEHLKSSLTLFSNSTIFDLWLSISVSKRTFFSLPIRTFSEMSDNILFISEILLSAVSISELILVLASSVFLIFS